MDAPLVFGLIIISLGTFIIPWIYTKNKEFRYLDKDAPNPPRGVVVLTMLPFIWGYSFYIIRKLIIKHPLTIGIEIVGWSFIIFLIIKYILDFCLSFGRITDTNGFLWFALFIIPILTIPAMQAELNSHFQRMQVRKKYEWLYD
jgi:hypothetical protein